MRTKLYALLALVFLTAPDANAQALFKYKLGAPIDRNSALTTTAYGPGQSSSVSESDIGQTPIDGSPIYGTSVSSLSEAGVSGAACGGTTADFDSTTDFQAGLEATPRARYIEFNAASSSSLDSRGQSAGICSLLFGCDADLGQSLSVPFSLTGSAVLNSINFRLDRSLDESEILGALGMISASSMLSWALHEDLDFDGIVGPNDPIADSGLAAQSITVGQGQVNDSSGSYTGVLPHGAYVLRCNFTVDEAVRGSFSVANVDIARELLGEVSGVFRLEIL